MFTIPRIWREKPQRYRLEASKCSKCGYVMYPPRKVCPKCGSEELTRVTLPETGKILTYTIIRTAPLGFMELSPYAVAIVEFPNGARAMMQIVDTDFDKIEIGKEVKIVFRKLFTEGESGVIMYGPKAIVVED